MRSGLPLVRQRPSFAASSVSTRSSSAPRRKTSSWRSISGAAAAGVDGWATAGVGQAVGKALLEFLSAVRGNRAVVSGIEVPLATAKHSNSSAAAGALRSGCSAAASARPVARGRRARPDRRRGVRHVARDRRWTPRRSARSRSRCRSRRSPPLTTMTRRSGARSASSAATPSAACSRAPASTMLRRWRSCAPTFARAPSTS